MHFYQPVFQGQSDGWRFIAAFVVAVTSTHLFSFVLVASQMKKKKLIVITFNDRVL